MRSLPGLRELWRRSQITGLKGAKWRVKFVLAALRHPRAYDLLASAQEGGGLAKLAAERPEVFSFLVSPYIDAGWDAEARVEALVAHVGLLTENLQKYGFSVNNVIKLCSLSSFGLEEFGIYLDKPIFFFREGVVTLNIFEGNFRFFSICFSFCHIDGQLGAIVGGIQGRRSDEMLDRYRAFTKQAHGLRPRDLLIEILRMLLRAEGASRLLAIQDEARHHRHPFFSRDVNRDLPLYYDDIWRDRGGVLDMNGYFDLPLQAEQDIERVPARKRSMYKKRFAALSNLEIELDKSLKEAVSEVVLPTWAS